LLEEIIAEALAQAPDMALAGRLADAQELVREAASTPADVVVLGTDDPQLIASALEQQPHLKVLAVSEDARGSSLYVLRPERTRIGDLSAGRLVATIRAVAEPVATWWVR
jgi:hypothetical protein